MRRSPVPDSPEALPSPSTAHTSANALAGRPAVRTELVLLAVLLVGFAMFAYQAGLLVAWPFEVDPWEGTEYIASLRLGHGQSCYGWPRTAAYPPRFYCYPPLFAAIGGGAQRIVEAALGRGACGLWVNRSLAVACALLLGAVIYRVVCRRSGTRAAGLAAALLMLAVEPSHRYLDIARPDILGLGLALSALWVLDQRSPRRRLWFVPLAVGALLCKQILVGIPVAGLWFTAGRDRREAALHAAALAAALLLVGVPLNAAMHGDLFRDVVTYQSLVHSDTVFPSAAGLSSLLSYSGRLLTWSAVLQIVAIGYARRHWRQRHATGGQWILAYVVATPLGLLSLMQWGAYPNRLAPAAATCSIVFGLALGEWLMARGRTGRWPSRWAALVPLLAAVHPLIHTPPSERLDTSPATRREYEVVSALCRQARGPVLSEMGLVAVVRARPDAVADLVAMKPSLGPVAQSEQAALLADVEAHRYALIAVYTGLHRPYTFMSPGVHDAVLREYEMIARLPRAGVVCYRPRPPHAENGAIGEAPTRSAPTATAHPAPPAH